MKRLFAGLCLVLSACATPHTPPQPTVPLPPPPPAGEPADLFGLTSTQLQVLFGAPSFTRKENGSEMWRYDNRQCRAFFFIYPAGRTNAVRHVETVPRGRDMAADVNCLAVLRGRPAFQPTPSS